MADTTTNLFDIARSNAEKTATAMGSTMLTGESAFAQSAGRRVPRDPERSRLMDGDEFTIPSAENDPSWLALPLAKGGDPVTRLLARVNRGGSEIPIDIFVGTLLKSATKPDGTVARSECKFKDGSNLADLSLACVSAGDVWRLCFGKRFKVSNAKEVTVRSRTRDGQPTTRNTWTYTFTEI